MQSETADFAPDAVNWRTGQNVVLSFILPIRSLM